MATAAGLIIDQETAKRLRHCGITLIWRIKHYLPLAEVNPNGVKEPDEINQRSLECLFKLTWILLSPKVTKDKNTACNHEEVLVFVELSLSIRVMGHSTQC